MKSVFRRRLGVECDGVVCIAILRKSASKECLQRIKNFIQRSENMLCIRDVSKI
jgi:hypothetical protein